MSTGYDESQADWSELAGSLPTHDDEVMSAHGGQPTIAEQNENNGAGTPAVDLGTATGSVVG